MRTSKVVVSKSSSLATRATSSTLLARVEELKDSPAFHLNAFSASLSVSFEVSRLEQYGTVLVFWLAPLSSAKQVGIAESARATRSYNPCEVSQQSRPRLKLYDVACMAGPSSAPCISEAMQPCTNRSVLLMHSLCHKAISERTCQGDRLPQPCAHVCLPLRQHQLGINFPEHSCHNPYLGFSARTAIAPAQPRSEP